MRLVGFLRTVRWGGRKGEVGAERGCEESMAGDSVDTALGLGKTFSERFLTFLALLPGDPGRGGPRGDSWAFTDPSRSTCSEATVAGLFITFLNGDNGAVEVGDSGDELGEGSVLAVTEAESKVDMVVVGEESVESDPTDVILPLWC